MSFGSPGEASSVSDKDMANTNTVEGAPSDEEMRPLPDGGLQTVMPDWLRRPPAWRNLPAKEAGEASSLPEPDTSIIDPRTLIDVADLPQWLQEIAARGGESSPSPERVVTALTHEDNAMQTNDPNNTETPVANERTVPFEPVDKKKWSVPEKETRIYGGGPPKGRSQTLMLAIAAVVIILLIILFVALMM